LARQEGGSKEKLPGRARESSVGRKKKESILSKQAEHLFILLFQVPHSVLPPPPQPVQPQILILLDQEGQRNIRHFLFPLGNEEEGSGCVQVDLDFVDAVHAGLEEGGELLEVEVEAFEPVYLSFQEPEEKIR
jgi:hypothetical protein